MVELASVVSDQIAEHLAERAREEHTDPRAARVSAVRTFLGPPSSRQPAA